MFVVFIEAPKGEPPFEHPFKAFSSRSTAVSWAAEQVDQDAESAKVFDVPGIEDARKAVAAAQEGEGILVDTRGKKRSLKDEQDDWRRAMAGDENALNRINFLDE